MKIFRVALSALLGITLAAASLSAQSTPTECKKVVTIAPVDFVKLSFANANFRFEDLIFVDASNTKAVQAKQAQFGTQGLALASLCSGTVVIFVDPSKHASNAEVMDVYDKLLGFGYAQAGITAFRPYAKTLLIP